MSAFPEPFICFHPRARWIAEGSGSWSMGSDGKVKSEHRTTGYRCGICYTWIPADAVEPTDREKFRQVTDRTIEEYKEAFDRLASE